MSTDYFEQQPIGRTVGRRVPPRADVPPSREARAALDSWAQRMTRVPKGIYRYANHDNMERDRDRWDVAAIVETVRSRGEYLQDVMLDGVRVRVLNLDGLLKTKSSARPKDQIDVAAITRALAELRK